MSSYFRLKFAALIFSALIAGLCFCTDAFAKMVPGADTADFTVERSKCHVIPKAVSNVTAGASGAYSDVNILGSIPFLYGLPDLDFQKNLNGIFSDFVIMSLDGLNEGVRQVEFSYLVIEDDGEDVVSILLYVKKQSDITERSVHSVNFSKSRLELAGITDVAGANAVKIINRLILSDSRRNPGKYNVSLASITSSQDFYIRDGKLVLVFDDYEMTPRKSEMFEFQASLSGFVNCYVTKSDYYSTAGYNVKMIMLKQVADEFGFELVWNSAAGRIIISRNGSDIVSLMIGLNNYSPDRNQILRLEAAPELVEGRTYLPVSFFEEILGLYTSINSEGTVCFSEYK